jgi:DNA polymerase III delta prime subunit
MIAGGPELVPHVLSLIEGAGIEIKGNPDLYVRTYKHFGIDDARELRQRAQLGALRTRRVFVIVAADMNREAQNALLKTLEETPGDALFFFLLPSPQTLLPTLRSRMQTLALQRSQGREGELAASQFLAAPPQKRLDLLKSLLEKDEDEKRDLGAILSFLSSLEYSLEKSESKEGLHAIYRAHKYIADKGALVKPLLEQVALLVPTR